MLQFSSSLFGWLAAPARAAPSVIEREARLSDPLSHPALKAMTPQELADIPFPRPRPKRARQTVREACC